MDRDYRGNLGVVMFNHSQAEFKVNKGDRIAQLICEKILYPELVELEVICIVNDYLNFHVLRIRKLPLQTLDATERGEGGFGSTGIGATNGANGKH